MTDFGRIIDANTIRFERTLPGSVRRVWDYVTRPERLAEWLAAGDFEPRAGGRVELRFDVDEVPPREKAGPAAVRGVVERCDAPNLLVYSWVDAANPAPETAVTFELDQRGENTTLVLTHRRLPAASVPDCLAGWHAHLGILEARLRGVRPEPLLTTFTELQPVYARMAATEGRQAAQPGRAGAGGA
jgi:uncharacterized protein YndB with AHSA1/START domain